MRFKRFPSISALLLFAALSPCAARAQDGDGKDLSTLPRQFTATAFGQAGATAGKSFNVNVYITSWTTDEQLTSYISTLRSGGPNALVRAMEKTSDAGRISPNGFVGTGARFARFKRTENGGWHIVLATNRRMAFGEVYQNTRSTQYQFAILVLDVDKNGKGTGTLAPVCKVKFNKQDQL